MRRLQLQLFIFLFSLAAQSIGYALEIPTGLRQNELIEVIDVLGVETSAKFLSNPYPLGGHSGFEAGLSSEFVNTGDLARLGNGTEREETFQYNRISVGKGLYSNLDGFVHFIPFSSSNEISEYGGSLKWGFYEAKRLPLTVSLLGTASTFNFDDRFINEALQWDVMSGLNLRNFALYFGAGALRTRSKFSQANLDASVPLNASNTHIIESQRTHSFVGLHVSFARMFFAAQIDRYENPVYSAKLGVRY